MARSALLEKVLEFSDSLIYESRLGDRRDFSVADHWSGFAGDAWYLLKGRKSCRLRRNPQDFLTNLYLLGLDDDQLRFAQYVSEALSQIAAAFGGPHRAFASWLFIFHGSWSERVLYRSGRKFYRTS